MLTAVGGTIMFLGGVCFFIVVVRHHLQQAGRSTEPQVIPVADVEHGAKTSWRILDSIGTWAIIAIVLSVLVEGEILSHYLPLTNVSPPIRLW